MGSIRTLACACVWRLSPLRMAWSMRLFTACSVSSGMVSASRARCTWGRLVRAGLKGRECLSLGAGQGWALPVHRWDHHSGDGSLGTCMEGVGASPAEPRPAGGQDTRLPTPKHTSGAGGARPRLCLPPPLCIPAPRGRGVNNIGALQRPSTAIATQQPGVEGAAVPHDGDGAGAVLGGRGRRGLPLPRPARVSPPPARGRRLVSPLPGEVQHPGRGGLGEPAQPHPRPRPRPPCALTFARPPPGRSPSPVQGRAAPLLRGQTPSGEAVRAGGGGALFSGGPRRPAVPAGLGATALGAGHGCGAGGGEGVRWRRGATVANAAAVALATEAAPAGAPPRHWPARRAAGPAVANGRPRAHRLGAPPAGGAAVPEPGSTALAPYWRF